MAHEETALRATLEIGAWSIAFAGAGVLLLALAAELLRRRRAAAPLVALADRLLPTTSRRIAVGLLTVVSTISALSVPPGARADDHRTRTWLEAGTRDTATSTNTTPTEPDSASMSTSTSSTTTTTAPLATTSTTTPVTSTAHVVAPRAAVVLRGAPSASSTSVAPPPAATRTVPLPPAPPTASQPTGDLPTYTVVPGDCLWSIAARRLGAGATGRAIDRGWRALYAANRNAIGADPNLIHPGLVLALPPLDPTP